MSIPQNTVMPSNNTTHIQQTNLRVISLVVMLGGWVLALAYVLGYVISRDARFLHLIAAQSAYSIALTIAWVLQRAGRHRASTWLMFLSTFVASIFMALTIEGIGVVLGVLVAIIFSIIAWQTLSTRSAALAILVSLLAGIAIAWIDINTPAPNRLTGGFFVTTLLIVAGGVVIFILLINALRGIEFRRIGAQIRAAFLVVSILPVLIVTVFQTATLTNVLTTQASNALRQNAELVTERVNTQLFLLASYVEEDASNPVIRNYLQKPDGSVSFLVLLASRYPGLISYGLLDKDGILVIDHRGSTRGNERDTAYFQAAVSTRITYISDVVLDEDTRRGVFFVSKPVLDEQGKLLGVLRAKISGEQIQSIAQESAAQFGTGFSVVILDEANIILAHSARPELRTKILAMPGQTTLNTLQQAGRLPLAGEISARMDELAAQIEQANPQTLFTGSLLPGETTGDYIALSSTMYKPWKVLTAQNAGVFLAPARNQVLSTLLIILFLLGAVYFGANLTTGLLVTPINRLVAAAQELGKGNLDTPLALARKDELGTLSAVLDNARRQIYDLLQTLEQRVEERTQQLTLANARNERRAQQLTTVSIVTHAIVSVQNVDEVLETITSQISEAFGYYHVGIFLLDENREYAVLRAANSAGGKAMLARGHRLRVGRQGIVGNVTNTGRYRIALDVGEDAVFFNNPDLPYTRSEAAFPLIIGEEIIGALDVQSTEPNAFSEDDLTVLGLLSDQIAIAIQNARQFEATRQAFAELQQLYAASQEIGWQSTTGEGDIIGYRYAKGNLEPLQKMPETATTTQDNTLTIPIALREKEFGVLKIRHSGRKSGWTENETRMYEAIAERMSFALENARLFAESRRRANLERNAAEAAAKISSSSQFESILRRAAEEISRFLDGAEVLVQIQPETLEKPAGKLPE
ncbi:MAG: GAF domain-containing protein [Anaerolineales bacterium]|nr:GAF domain-containing protein [Anaerolineales bacterium]